jgi:sulfate adenylyltransferase subunit 1 (EFTu-like GTPase family)
MHARQILRLALQPCLGLCYRGRSSRVKEIVTYDGPLASAASGDAVTLTLADDIDIARGDVLVSPTACPEVSDQFAAHIIWMSEEPLFPGRHASAPRPCRSRSRPSNTRST